MKRFLTAFLCLALLLSIFSVPVHAQDTDVVIDSADDPFPADTTIEGDLTITGACPDNIVLINVKIEGTVTVETTRPVTLRFQGDSGSEEIIANSNTHIIGGSHGTIVSNALFTKLERGSAEEVILKKDNGYFYSGCPLGDVTMKGARSVLTGGYQAETITITRPDVSYEGSGTYESLERDYEEAENEIPTKVWNNRGVKATLTLERSHVSPADNIVRGKLTFTEVPADMVGDYRIYWYIGSNYAAGAWHLDVKTGAVAEFECSAHFTDTTPDFLPVWAEVTNNSDADIQLCFAKAVEVRDYSIAEYKDLEYDETIFPYEIHLLRDQNVIIVYGLDDKGKYSKIINVFVCSVGIHNPTPTGEFEINYKARWGSLMLDLWGQYVSQFNGNMLFHSVPYRSREPFNIEWEEYNLLGTPASSGCVRMSTIDAMWIYDHCRAGTRVTIYDNGSCPVDKPVPVFINDEGRLRGWDPTDPYEANPTRAKFVPDVHFNAPVSLDQRAKMMFQ